MLIVCLVQLTPFRKCFRFSFEQYGGMDGIYSLQSYELWLFVVSMSHPHVFKVALENYFRLGRWVGGVEDSESGFSLSTKSLMKNSNICVPAKWKWNPSPRNDK